MEKEDFLEQSKGKTVLYRGVSEKKYADEFRNGKVYIGKNVDNVRGNGIYTTSNKKLADDFTKDGSVVEMFFTNDENLKTIETPYLKEIRQIMCQSHPEEFLDISKSEKNDLIFDSAGDYINSFFNDYANKNNKSLEDFTEDDYKSVGEIARQDPVFKQLKENRVKYFKTNIAAMFYNLGLLAKFLGYNVLYTDAYDFDFKEDDDEDVKEYSYAG